MQAQFLAIKELTSSSDAPYKTVRFIQNCEFLEDKLQKFIFSLGQLCQAGICDQCKEGFYLYFETQGAEPKCFGPTDQPGYGISKNGFQYLESCEVADCELCYLDSSACTKCASPKKVLNLDGVYSCVVPSTSYGLDTQNTGFVKACSEGTTNCDHCDPNDYTKCSGCKSGFRLVGAPPSSTYCNTNRGGGNLLDGYGFDPSDSSKVQKCSIDGCKKCREDYTKCTECLPVGGVEYKVNPSGLCSTCLSSDAMFIQGNLCLNCDQKCTPNKFRCLS